MCLPNNLNSKVHFLAFPELSIKSYSPHQQLELAQLLSHRLSMELWFHNNRIAIPVSVQTWSVKCECPPIY